ncbi:rhamnulokinase family protein [Streptomyces sp. NPDC047123]|uniref:rhamnulokinase n=1 Tax=Streptomyces sp. NPDC047123 TaxID=3155622 RepID=UPI0033DC5644
MVGRAGPGGLSLQEVHRFPNRPVRVGATLYWDVLALYRGVLDGLRAAGAAAGGRITSVGVDSWAVDYGLLDADGDLLGNPVHYRDARTQGVGERVGKVLSAQELYGCTGIQALPFNTVNQLVVARGGPRLAAARTLLMIPDLVVHWLTGGAARGTELTNASTTQLVDPRTRDWSRPVADALGIDLGLFPPLRQPGDHLGELAPEVLAETGLTGPVRVTAVASHDTASAVVAVPAADPVVAYVATGTWSLAGLELDAPVLTEESRRADFSNELGVDGTVRYLRNTMGLWLLQECLREWGYGPGGGDAGPEVLDDLLREAALVAPLRAVVDAGSAEFLAPGRMPERIAAACRRAGRPEPRGRAETVRCVLDSLALAHRVALGDAQRLSGRTAATVHVVGGGSRNELLCRLTADACGLPVEAGPAEAAALGNVLVQARAAGVLAGGLPELRAQVRASERIRRYEPTGDTGGSGDWAAAEAVVGRRPVSAPCIAL